MADRKKDILAAALELFAHNGYDATSTKKIALKSEVSEGLIFRHYKNKKGLLQAIMKQAEERLEQMLLHILTEEDPKSVIRKTIELPFQVEKEHYDFWRLQYILKWEKEYFNPHKMKPLADKVTAAFASLNIENPDKEALMLSHVLDSITVELLRDNLPEQEAYQNFLLKKYNV